MTSWEALGGPGLGCSIVVMSQAADAQGRRHYGDHRPYPDPPAELADLTGPTSGLIELPLHIDWGPKAPYDLAKDSDRRVLYETVLLEAASTEELCRYVNGPLLVQAWPRLWLPQRVRQNWEGRFSVLQRVA